MRYGDKVKLKSGGPDMLVLKELDNSIVLCVWLDDDKPITTEFHEDALEYINITKVSRLAGVHRYIKNNKVDTYDVAYLVYNMMTTESKKLEKIEKNNKYPILIRLFAAVLIHDLKDNLQNPFGAWLKAIKNLPKKKKDKKDGI